MGRSGDIQMTLHNPGLRFSVLRVRKFEISFFVGLRFCLYLGNLSILVTRLVIFVFILFTTLWQYADFCCFFRNQDLIVIKMIVIVLIVELVTAIKTMIMMRLTIIIMIM